VPNLPTHVDLAWQAAGMLSRPLLSRELGSYLLGATAPDVRIITKRPRVDTHFFDLASGGVGDGASGLFAAYPELRSPASDAKAAFVAGYLTHLAADETWIVSMYRPYFGESSPRELGRFGSRDAAQLYDRAAQLKLDRACEQRVRSLLPVLDETPEGLSVGPLDEKLLREWRAWVLDFLTGDRPYSWDRLRHMANRISNSDPQHPSQAIADRFLSDVPAGLKTLHEVVPESELERYMERATANLVTIVDEYLSDRATGAPRQSRQDAGAVVSGRRTEQ
jgi:hypothetical protein